LIPSILAAAHRNRCSAAGGLQCSTLLVHRVPLRVGMLDKLVDDEVDIPANETDVPENPVIEITQNLDGASAFLPAHHAVDCRAYSCYRRRRELADCRG